MQKRFLTLCVAAALSASTAAQAGAASPTGSWTVGPIGAKTQDGRSLCSMKNSYSNGVSLVFARDAMGSNTLAIELPDSNLESGKQYPLKLSIDHVERAATALAAGTNVLVTQMGADDVFFDMLSRKSALHASFTGGSYDFGLKGTSKALLALDNCAVILGGGKPKQARAALPPVFADLSEGFDAPIVGSSYAHGGETIIKVTRRDAEAPLERDTDNGGSLEVESLRAENKALELENRATLARLEAAELARRATESKKETAVAATERELQESLDHLKRVVAENESLQKELAAARARAEDLSALQTKLSLAEREKQDARRALEDAQKRLTTETANARKQVEEQLKLRIEAEAQQKSRLEAQRVASVAPAAGGGRGVKDILARANVANGGGVIRTAGEAYNWETDGLYGSAEEYPWTQGQNFRQVAEGYIKSSSSRCAGDFAFTLGQPVKSVSGETIEAEIACLDGVNDAAAAVLFVADADKLVVITHEGATEQMETALANRAKVAASLK